MEILLTGANGYIGATIKDYLCGAYNFKTLGRKTNSDYKFDIVSSIPSFGERFKVVIHNAGKAHSIPQSLSEADFFYEVNFHGTVNLLKALESRPPLKFIFISTVAVYGLSKGINITEEAPLLATDPYGKSKLLAENFVLEWCKQKKVKCAILRLPLVVGINPPGNLGAMIKGIQKGYYFNIDGGKARKSMVLAEDIAKHILKAGEVGGIYNLTDGYHPNFEELSQLIAKQSGNDKVLNMPYLPAKIAAVIGNLAGKFAPLNTDKLNKITATLTFDDSKARAAFGWNPTPVLKGFKIS